MISRLAGARCPWSIKHPEQKTAVECAVPPKTDVQDLEKAPLGSPNVLDLPW
jgi:hypothetical protein